MNDRTKGTLLTFLLMAAQGLQGEEGRFLLHKSMKPVGEEAYVVECRANGMDIRSDFHFRDRGRQVSLKADMDLKTDGTVLRMNLKGNTSRYNALDLSVDATTQPARVLENGQQLFPGQAEDATDRLQHIAPRFSPASCGLWLGTGAAPRPP